jgi:gamma-glutamylcyclotransferase
MRTFLYLAYGSNLHPLRLGMRVASQRLLGVTSLAGARVEFAKRGRDGSGKLSLQLTGEPADSAWGAVYEVAAVEKPRLDRAEDLGRGYRETKLEVRLSGRSREAFTYVVTPEWRATGLKPYDWYQALVVRGAFYHGFPPEYIAGLAGVASMVDPDPKRRRRHEHLLEQIDACAGPGARGQPRTIIRGRAFPSGGPVRGAGTNRD